MRREILDFRQFMKGEKVQKKKKRKDVVLRSAWIGGVTLQGIINTPQFVSNAYLVMGGIGLVAISIATLERALAKNNKHIQADWVAHVGRFIFPVTFAGILVYFAVWCPLW
ncbi:hypothetical protein WD019_03240 [Fictibacillus sp. Mic-4]|uniref:hypothetical protein n=1 Tax=Fictibacillus sp. Mic-4 TaxID=3132826 RepID=UPI003CF87CD5